MKILGNMRRRLSDLLTGLGVKGCMQIVCTLAVLVLITSLVTKPGSSKPSKPGMGGTGQKTMSEGSTFKLRFADESTEWTPGLRVLEVFYIDGPGVRTVEARDVGAAYGMNTAYIIGPSNNLFDVSKCYLQRYNAVMALRAKLDKDMAAALNEMARVSDWRAKLDMAER